MRIFLSVLLLFGAVSAQESDNYKLNEHTFNAGGHPEAATILTSTNYRITIDSIGEGIIGRGLSSASFTMDAGLVPAYPPPGEITGLRFTDDSTLVWDPERSVGVYNLYREALSTLSGLDYGTCEQHDLATATTTDSDTPTPAGEGFFYLVTAENRLDEEGTKGWDSLDGERANDYPCP